MKFRLLFLNAFLLRPVSLGVGPLRWEPGAAPTVADRAAELGRTVAGHYDVVALAEAFSFADRERVLAGWADRVGRRSGGDHILAATRGTHRDHAGGGNHGPGGDRGSSDGVGGAGDGDRPQVAVGPEGGWGAEGGRTMVSSGLVTVVDGPSLVRTARHRYRTGGHRLADADPWAAKGVLLAEVDVGLPGRVEVYSTHLCAGGGLLPAGGDRVGGTDGVRRAQAEELAAFVTATHRSGNLVVVVGDMNVPDRRPGSVPAAPSTMVGDMNVPDGGSGGVDGPDRGPGSVSAAPSTVVGGIDGPDGGSGGVGPSGAGRSGAAAGREDPHRVLAEVLGRVGLFDAWEAVGLGPGPTSGLDRHGAALGVLDPDDPRFASDAAAPAVVAGRAGPEPSERIDRVFLARPRPEDRVVVQEVVLRRRPFPRRADAPDRHRLGYLSDHLGLHLELTLARPS